MLSHNSIILMLPSGVGISTQPFLLILQGPNQTLLPGWVAIQDPNSGQTYYANQSTGESSWEPPVAASAPEPQQGVAASIASKYGDGFVTSASNPQLAEQYGNVGTR